MSEREPWRLPLRNSRGERAVEILYESSKVEEPGSAIGIALTHGLAILERDEVIALRDALSEWIGDGTQEREALHAEIDRLAQLLREARAEFVGTLDEEGSHITTGDGPRAADGWKGLTEVLTGERESRVLFVPETHISEAYDQPVTKGYILPLEQRRPVSDMLETPGTFVPAYREITFSEVRPERAAELREAWQTGTAIQIDDTSGKMTGRYHVENVSEYGDAVGVLVRLREDRPASMSSFGPSDDGQSYLKGSK
jgi:hypothetical protein